MTAGGSKIYPHTHVWEKPNMESTRNSPDAKFTKQRYIIVTIGIILYMVDIGTDIWVAIQFYIEGHYAWFALTILFVLTGSVVPQIFSYVWLSTDEETEQYFRRKRTKHIFRHILQLGVFTRYFQLLKKGANVIQSEDPEHHREMFAITADLTMLRLFETFLESTPQLLLQIYIILGHNHRSIIQYLCIVGSFFSIAWATVEYRRCMRRSIPYVREMPAGLPTAVYLFYKLFTIVSRNLSLSLLVVLNPYCTSAFAILWLFGTIWAHILKTDFCTSRWLEWFYRGIIGVILIFTFFNVKGRDMRMAMTVYYGLYTSLNFIILLLFYFLKSQAEMSCYFLPVVLVIAGSTIAGLVCLIVFYAFLHPRSNEQRATVAKMADEVDFRVAIQIEPDRGMTSSEKRMKAFLQH